MAVVAFLAPAFFGPKALLVSWGLVLFSMLALVLSGSLLNKLIFNGQRSAFIMEMPLYHLPNARTIGLLVWQRSLSFVKKAGTNILGDGSGDLGSFGSCPAAISRPVTLSSFGKLIEPVGRWMGFDWRLTVALITSFPAKENAIATLGVLFGSSPNAGLVQSLTSSFSIASGLSFLVVTMLFIPCMATVSRHPPGNGFLGLDPVQPGLLPGPLGCRWRRCLSSRACPGTLAMLYLHTALT